MPHLPSDTPNRPRTTRRLLTGALAVTLPVLLVAGVASTSGAAGIAPAGTAKSSAVTKAAVTPVVPRPAHTVVVMLENKQRSRVIGSADAPFINSLAAEGANMSQSYGVTHPSQPNYVALFSGDQHGVTNDSCPQNLGSKENLGHQLISAKLTFKGYAESLPKAGYTGCVSGNYMRKHNPWVDFSNVPASSSQPFSTFPTDFTKLPTVSFVTPNMCSDMHNCPVATGDRWMKKNIGPYAAWARTHNSLLVVTFDENDGGTVNTIPTVLVGQMVKPGLYTEKMNHYNLLRTIETAYGLPGIGHAASAAPLKTPWTTSAMPSMPTTGVSNSSFESGLNGWVRSGTTGTAKTVRHGGTMDARVGGTTGTATKGDSILSQTFTAPAGKTKLTIAWFGSCDDKVSKAWATVVVKHNTSGKVSTPLAKTCTRSAHWAGFTDKITPGHSYTVQLINHDDGVSSTPNTTYFDDVTLS